MTEQKRSYADTRASFLQQNSTLHTDYSIWQRTQGSKSGLKDNAPNAVPSPEMEVTRIQIAARRKTLAQYQKIRAQLVAANIELVTGIQQEETDVHEEVAKLLQQYETFRGAISEITSKGEKAMEQAKEELESIRIESSKEIAELETKLHELEQSVAEKAVECEVLIKFKGTDREYHLRMARMNELKAEIDMIMQEQITDRHELASLVEKHHTRFANRTNKKCKEIQATLTAAALEKMPVSVRDTAYQNYIMKKEIEVHKQCIREIEVEISEERAKIRSKASELKSEAYSNNKRLSICTPETNVSLDIPTYKPLQI